MRIFRALAVLLLLAVTPGCTVVSADRVFPKLAWYWSKDAQRQRESDRMEKRQTTFHRTNDWSQTPR